LKQTIAHYALKQAREHGCQIATVLVTQDNYAMYERLGFHEIGRTSLLVWLPPVFESSTEE
jgi:N-acetylglutamate synthase-like GNAT family acetyltransferase